MECDKAAAAQNRADSHIFATVYTILAVVLVAALAAGGRDVMAVSDARGTGRISNITARP